jgi:hypothetical protein
MSKPASQITHRFDQAELDSRVSNAVTFYQNREDTPRQPGAIVQVLTDWPSQMLDQYDELSTQGYKRHPTMPVTSNGSYSQLFMLKPQHMQDADVALITQEVAELYDAERFAAYEAHKQHIIAESVQRAKTAEAKKAADAEAKLLERLRLEAEQALGEFA